MKQLTVDDLEYLAQGSAILGSGGGGDSAADLRMARHQIEQNGSVPLLDIKDLEPEALVVPVAFMGAPIVSEGQIPSGKEFPLLISLLEKYTGKRPTALIAAEIGGGNAFTPITAAAMLGLPVLDGDTLGRAFPEIQMSSCRLKGISTSPTFLCDNQGNRSLIEAIDASWTETLARHLTVAMGSSAAIALYLMSGAQAKECIVAGSVTQAIRIGKVLKHSGAPLKSLLEEERGVFIGSGEIFELNQVLSEGFLKGDFKVRCDSRTLTVGYQNEYLIVREGAQVVVTTPDIITLIESGSTNVIASEQLKNGLKADIIALPAPEIWRSEAGLSIVGPRYFGYGVEYKPI